MRVAHALASQRRHAALESNAEVAESVAVALLGAQDKSLDLNPPGVHASPAARSRATQGDPACSV
jgi:hypothetical protein